MNSFYKQDAWQIIEEGFHPEMNRESESIFSIGNSYMGQRANFEEHYSGDNLQGSYVAGVYYPDKTRVGWWKNGYPEYFAKVLNAPNWIGIDISVNGKEVDLATSKTEAGSRSLNRKEGYLERSFRVTVDGNRKIKIKSRRFVSMAEPDLGIIKYTVKSIDFEGTLDFTVYIDGDVKNEDTNFGEKCWEEVNKELNGNNGVLVTRTLKADFHVATGMSSEFLKDNSEIETIIHNTDREKYIAGSVSLVIRKGEEITLNKFAVVLSSLNNAKDKLTEDTKTRLTDAKAKGYARLFLEHTKEWERIWATSDVVIEGDISAQQAIRFNFFHLKQPYPEKDEGLNTGPKGFTGKKYGGSTYWDTEAFGLPFFLKTADRTVGKNLLLYRYKHLEKSIANAEKLGFNNGAALYPMVTMNGEECHNEWEITFEEIHRNGAIAFAILNYIRHTGDNEYMADYGFEVLLAISRFWAQRVNWSENLQKFVMLGVTGPNEYENNVNNNFHTNRIAQWTLKYTLEIIEYLKEKHFSQYDKLKEKWAFNEEKETAEWQNIIPKIHLP